MKKIHYISLFMSLVMAFSFFMTAFVGCTVKENSPKKQLVHCDLIEPTCTENGRKEVWYEAYTNTYFLDSEGKEIIAAEDIIIPAEGHDMSFHPSKNASCTENGNVEYWSCSKCGHTYSDKYGNKILPNFIINSTGHKLAYNSKKEATCTTTGLEEHYECLNCNKVYLDQQCQKSIDPSELIIPAKGHSPIKQENVISVCVQDSQNIELLYVCSDCGKTFADKGCLHELETSVHDVSLVNEIAPKCTTEGIKEHYNCNVCGKNFLDKACTQLIEDVSLAPKGHSLTYYEKVTETSVKDGIKEHYFCSNCQRNYLDYDCTNECTENDLLLPATIGAEIVSYTFASVAFELLSYGYEVFNAVADINGDKTIGIGYSDLEEAWQFDNDPKTYISSGFFAFEAEAKNASKSKNAVYITPIDDWGNEVTDEDYGYIVGFQEDGMLDGHYIADGEYIKYSTIDGEVKIEKFENKPSNYDLTLGSLYDYDKDEYIFIPYDDISSEPIEYVPLTEIIDGEKVKTNIRALVEEQERNGYQIESITIAHISVEALNALKGVLSQQETFNGYTFEYLNSLDFDNSKQYIQFNDDGTISIKDTPPMPVTKSILDWIVDGLILVGTASIAIVCVTFGGPAGAVVAAGVVGAGIEYFNQAVIQGKRFTDVNYAKVGIMAISGALGAVVPCSGALGFLAAGVLGGVTSAAMTAVDGGSWQEILMSAGQGALTSVLMHGLFASCFPAGTQILTNKGLVAIEAVTVGMLVASYNVMTGKVEYQPVMSTFKNVAAEFIDLTLSDGSTITSTANHPYFSVTQNGYISADRLQVGETLLSADGKLITIEEIKFYKLDNEETVYNLNILLNHNYFVDDCTVLVHNNCGSTKFNDDQRAVIELAKGSQKGLSREEAETLVGWANEYGLKNHLPMIHPNRGGIWSYTEHIKVFKYHIPIIY